MSNDQLALRDIVDNLDAAEDAELAGRIMNEICSVDKQEMPLNPLKE